MNATANRPHGEQGEGRTGPDVSELGAPKDGKPQRLDRRLFMQLLVYSGCRNPEALAEALQKDGLPGVLYLDAHDPEGVGLLSWSEDPGLFTGALRQSLHRDPFRHLWLKPEYSMLGRSYAGGYEADLEDWLLRKPVRNVTNPAWPWAVWYPLRRTGEFSKLPREEQGKILREHGAIGRAYGEADLAHDVRLACFGLDRADNDFVIGLIGKELHPLSHVVQTMRRTQQTSGYMEKMGPFFVGRAFWRSQAG